ncbi:ABC-2 transporter permease [Ruminococcus sp.]|uniref:ABC-2 transporter permease n=1 Tax=Ruminococcus sp. TaxID=41978 RepID=UPI0025DF291A|nr:ABC-2 transporter permease [Ruminococcus sp.]MBQ6169875.1 ABC-2 transporter permease [Ruminococcus sp.]MBQ6251785.1 ABC-2 transporter permease [Ruminococcus sp.]
MTGLVYKEWKQNRWFILSMILCGLAPLFVLLLMRGEISNIGNAPLRIGGLIAGFLVAGALQMLVLCGDDRKLWGYWITATPDGYKGFLRVKYEMIFAMVVLFLFSMQCVDRGYCAVAADMGITEIDEVSGIAVPLCFVQILFRAIDIPFVYRFGSKKGSFVKLICLIVLTIILLALLFLNTERLDTMIDACRKVFSVQNSSLILSVGLVVCLALYYLSYRITCRLYLKGVEQYDH